MSQARARSIETSVLRGAAKGLAGEQKIDADPRGLDTLMSASSGLPAGVFVAFGLALGVGLLLEHAVWGRHVVAIGSNARTARLCSGLPWPWWRPSAPRNHSRVSTPLSSVAGRSHHEASVGSTVSASRGSRSGRS